MITFEQLRKLTPYSIKARLQTFVDPLNDAMREYDINTRFRAAAFLAQIAHESGSFNYTKEIESGDKYEFRKDLGNVYPGDGPKYKGRGLIQITGRANYQEVSKALGMDFINKPELLCEPSFAAHSAAWWWKKHGLNEMADKEEFEQITKIINGGLNGYQSRKDFYKKALEIL